MFISNKHNSGLRLAKGFVGNEDGAPGLVASAVPYREASLSIAPPGCLHLEAVYPRVLTQPARLPNEHGILNFRAVSAER